MNELVPVFESSLFEHPIEIGSELLEIGIDSVLKDGLLKDIPIVGTILSAGKFAQNIYDRNLIKQTVAFITEFNSGELDDEKLQKYRGKLACNPKFAEEELGRVLILLNKTIDTAKSRLLARFYRAHTHEEISWDVFCELCDITDRLFLADLEKMEEAYRNHGVKDNMPISYKHDRLISTGLLTNEARLSGNVVMGSFDSGTPETIMTLTQIGDIFCQYAFNG